MRTILYTSFILGSLLAFLFSPISPLSFLLFPDQEGNPVEILAQVGFDKQMKHNEVPLYLLNNESETYYYGRYKSPVRYPFLHSITPFQQFWQKKEWHYTALVVDKWLMGIAVADFGYASTFFLYVYDNSTGWSDNMQLISPFGLKAEMAESSIKGCSSWFSDGVQTLVKQCYIGDEKNHVWQIDVDLKLDGGSHVSASFKYFNSESMCLSYPLGIKRPSYVHKASGMLAQGFMKINSEYLEFNNGLVNHDWTRALLRRETVWAWASLAFFDKVTSKQIGIQLSRGVYDDENGVSLEAAIWVDGVIHTVNHPVIFQIPKNRAMYEPWKITSDKINLEFVPKGVQRSKFWVPLIFDIDLKHCFGFFRGTLNLDGTVVVSALGVAEDHFAVW